MCDTAAHLSDEVLPEGCDYRQWTLSLPKRIRAQLAREPQLLSAVLDGFIKTLFAWQRRRARNAGIEEPLVGGITLIQRHGSLLTCNPHFHSWLPDAVFQKQPDGAITACALLPPTDDDIENLLAKVIRRTEKIVARFSSGLEDDGTEDALSTCFNEAAQTRLFIMPNEQDHPTMPLCRFASGYSLHANLRIEANRRDRLEAALRYGCRPAIVPSRLKPPRRRQSAVHAAQTLLRWPNVHHPGPGRFFTPHRHDHRPATAKPHQVPRLRLGP
jgi:hypothetical protein